MSLPSQTILVGVVLAVVWHRGVRAKACNLPVRRSDFGFDLLAPLLVALRMILGRHVPLYALPVAPFDDRLFLQQATALADGRWLGDYSSVILAKGPGFALFWASMHELGVSLVIPHNLVYGLACWALVAALRQGKRPVALWWQVLAMALVLFAPIGGETGVMVRAWRQAWWTALCIGVVATAIGWALAEGQQRVRALWGAGLGLTLGLAWITRGEAVWLLAPAALLLAFGGWRERARWRQWAWAAVVPVGLAALVVGAVCVQNARHFGLWGISDFNDAAFKRAYGALARVEPHDAERRIPVTRAARERVYAVSPGFRLIRQEMEQGIGAVFMQVTEDNLGIPKSEAEIGGGWFVWALREAVNNAGLSPDAAAARDYYSRLADEIDAGFADGRLSGAPARSSLSPVLEPRVHGPKFLSSWWRSVTLHFTYRINPSALASHGGEADLAWVARMAGQSVASTDPAMLEQQASAPKIAVWRFLDGTFYRWVVHPLAAIAAVWILLGAARLRWTESVVAGLAVVGAILANSAVVALVDATSWNAVGLGYLGATMVFVPVPLVLVLRQWALGPETTDGNIG